MPPPSEMLGRFWGKNGKVGVAVGVGLPGLASWGLVLRIWWAGVTVPALPLLAWRGGASTGVGLGWL